MPPVIVSHEHRFVFVQVPQTGCTAIGAWMVEHLNGEKVLRKHTTLSEARRVLGSSIEGYPVIASVRDSIDQFVSSYYKVLTRPGSGAAPRSWYGLRSPKSRRDEWARSESPTIDAYIDRFVRRPHAPVWALSLRRADLVLRYEQIDQVPGLVARLLAIDDLPPVPHVNETDRDRRGLQELASTTQYQKALRYHRPYRFEFGYTDSAPSSPDRARYELLLRAKDVERRRNDRLLRSKLAAGS